MNITKYRITLAAMLLANILIAMAYSELQRGPDWEIPATVMQNYFKISVLATLLLVVAAVLYVQGKWFADVALGARRGLQIALAVAAVLLGALWLGVPMQWRGRTPILSRAASMLPLMMILSGSFAFWLCGFRMFPTGRLRSGILAVVGIIGFILVSMVTVVAVLMI